MVAGYHRPSVAALAVQFVTRLELRKARKTVATEVRNYVLGNDGLDWYLIKLVDGARIQIG